MSQPQYAQPAPGAGGYVVTHPPPYGVYAPAQQPGYVYPAQQQPGA